MASSDSVYYRAKMATRAKAPTGKLDKDGFEKWADEDAKPDGFFVPPGHQRGVEKMPEEIQMEGGRRHRSKVGGAIKDDIESAINTWQNVKISGKPLKDWSLIPSSVKEFVQKLIDVFDVIKAQAPQLKEALEKYGESTGPGAAQAKTVLGVVKSAGFGKPDFKKLSKHGDKAEEWMRHHRGEEGVRFMRGLHRVGGDAFDDKLKSISSAAPAALASVESAYPATKPPIAGVRKAYNFYDSVKKGAPAVKAALQEYAPAVAAKVVPALEKVGLGRRRKHGGQGLDGDAEQVLGISASRYGVKPFSSKGYRQFEAEGGKRGRGAGASSWVEHVKEYAKEHGCSYKEAMSRASASWKK